MTQSVTVQTVQNLEELKGLKLTELKGLVKQFREEDIDCLATVTSRTGKEKLIEALAEHMGFNVTTEIETAVQSEIIEAVQNSDDTPPTEAEYHPTYFGDDAYRAFLQDDGEENPEMQDVMDFGESVPTLEMATDADLFSKEESKPEPEEAVTESTGDNEVDAVLAELGLDGLDELQPPTEEEAKDLSTQIIEEHIEEQEKKPKKKRTAIPMDAPIPVRQFNNLILGIYGNVLEEREEPFPAGHKYEGCTWEEIKLERFNAKAHESFRSTKGNMHLVYTNVGSTYLIVFKGSDGTMEPVLEVQNKGRGHLRCKQIANHLQVAYNEKKDQEVISSELYGKLTEQIELMPINLPVNEPTEDVKTEENQGA